MALFEPYGPGEGLKRARRYGGRQLRGLIDDSDPSRLKEVSTALAQDVDPERFRSLYRDRLAQALTLDKQVAPLVERDDIRSQLDAPYGAAQTNDKGEVTGYAADPLAGKRDLMRERLRKLPKYGSVGERFDPRAYGSTAMRQFGSLYRNFGS